MSKITLERREIENAITTVGRLVENLAELDLPATDSVYKNENETHLVNAVREANELLRSFNKILSVPEEIPEPVLYRWTSHLMYKHRGLGPKVEVFDPVMAATHAEAVTLTQAFSETFLKKFEENEIVSWEVRCRPCRDS